MVVYRPTLSQGEHTIPRLNSAGNREKMQKKVVQLAGFSLQDRQTVNIGH